LCHRDHLSPLLGLFPFLSFFLLDMVKLQQVEDS